MNKKKWLPDAPQTERTFYFLIFALIVCGLAVLLFLEHRGVENTINWDILSELGEIPVQLDSDPNGGKLFGKAFIIKEQFVPSPLVISTWLVAGYLGVGALALVLLLCAVVALPRLWYLASMTIFVGLLASFRLEILQLFGSTNALAFGAVVLLLGGLSYYFHAFRPHTDFRQKAFGFALLLLLLGILAHFGARAPLPALTLASYSVLGMGALSVVFIFFNSFEVIVGFVYVVSNRRTGLGKNSLLNFLFISFLYLLTVLLIYLQNTRQLTGDFWLVSPFALLAISTILGFWGFKKRTKDYLPFDEVGAWLYAGGALLTVATVAYALGTNNNPLIEVFEDAIVYSQLALATVFVFYAGLNFYPLFKQGLEVHKVLYKPLKMSLAQVWTVGGLAAVSLLAADRFLAIDQAQAGYYNALGDLYTTTKEYKLAEEYYKLALQRDFQNHKSNFSLASLALAQGDRPTAGVYFNQALRKNPSPQAYAGLSKALLDENLFFDAIFNLRRGNQAFPKSGELQTNLGYLYARTRIADSTLYYWQLAPQNTRRPEVAAANLLAFYAQNPELAPAQDTPRGTYPSYEANRLAQLRTTDANASFAITLPADSALSVNNLAYLYNYATHQRDTTLLPLLRRLEEKESNFYDDLQLARAYVSYYGGNKIEALDLLASKITADTSAKTALNRQTLNFWLAKESSNSFGNLVALKTEVDYQNALRQSPFDVALLQQATVFFNQQKRPQIAYQAILNALRFNRTSPAVQQLYIMQALQMHLTDFAEDGLKDLAALVSPADFQAFLKTYQAQRQQVEAKKNMEW